jgi:15-cis-phytoene synthase
MTPELRASYAACRRIHRRHDPVYYLATRRLPADVRPAVHALYGFVRVADDLVDGPRRPARPEARRRALDDWERALQQGIAAGSSPRRVIAALVDAGRRHELPLEELSIYMRSMRVDCAPVRMETRADLEAYMQGSAAAVGRIMAPLLGAPADGREALARLGIAFQLTNFIRDVPEDYSLDRIYLPRDERERAGVEDRDFSRRRASPALRALVASEVERARALFASTDEAIEGMPAAVLPGIRLARAVYRGVLDRVERLEFDVLGRRAALSPWEVGWTAMGALRGSGAGRLA